MKKKGQCFSTEQPLLLYLLFAFIPLIIISYFITNEMIETISQKSTDVIKYEAKQSAEAINNEMDSLLNVIYNVATDKEILKLCKEYSNSNNNQINLSTKLTDKFSFYMDLTTNIVQFIYITLDNDYMVSQRYQDATYYANWSDKEYRESIINQTLEKNSILFLPSDNINIERPRNTHFYIVLPVRNTNSQDNIGIMVIAISNSFFRNFSSSNTDDFPEILDSSHRLIIDENETIIFADDLSYVGKTRNSYINNYELNNEKYIPIEYEISQTSWTFYSYQPKKLVFDSVSRMQILILLLISIFSIVMIYIIIIVISHHNKKIRVIADGIKQYNGQDEYSISQSNNKDLNIIVDQFNLAISRIKDLLQSLKEEKRLTAESMEQSRRAELKTLEAQINPHFLYNTLDTINWMAIDKNEYKISKMVSTLGSLLRYSVVNIDAPVLVVAEIEWLKKYLYLQEQRFKDVFTHTIDIMPGVENYPIFKMLIQPLVENCVLHAFHDTKTGGHICISFSFDKQYIYIIIKDNGCGIPTNKLSRINSGSHNIGSHTSSIGLDNVFNRLDAYYKQNGKLFLRSDENGTIAELTIPLMIEE